MSSQPCQCYQTSYGPFPKTIFQDYFVNFSVGPTKNFDYVGDGSSVGDDGVATYDPVNRLLDINSGVGGAGFAKTWTPTVPDPAVVGNRYHYTIISNKTFPVPSNGEEFVYEACFSATQQIGTIPPSLAEGVTDPNSDLRIASAGIFMATGFAVGMFSIFVTNNVVYAGYERLSVFSHFIPIEVRPSSAAPIDEYSVYAMAYNKKAGYVRWLINGVEKYRVYNVGVPLDRSLRLVDKTNANDVISFDDLSIGISTYAPLDFINPVKGTGLLQLSSAAATAPGTPLTAIGHTRPLVMFEPATSYIDPTRVVAADGSPIQVGQSPSGGLDTYSFLVPADVTTATRLFGNGAEMKIKFVHVHTVKPY